jgi:hypothetical protein
MILDRETKELRMRITALWDERVDTVGMSYALQLPEARIERELHAALEIRRAFKKLADGK